MKTEPNKQEDIKPDLKHDTMEFSAPADGEDRLDTDDASYEEEGITAEELAVIEDEPDNEAAALNAVETDRQTDEDNLPDEDWTEDLEEEGGEEKNGNGNEEEDENEDEEEEKVF